MAEEAKEEEKEEVEEGEKEVGEKKRKGQRKEKRKQTRKVTSGSADKRLAAKPRELCYPQAPHKERTNFQRLSSEPTHVMWYIFLHTQINRHEFKYF